jgi:hypothetical protein
MEERKLAKPSNPRYVLLQIEERKLAKPSNHPPHRGYISKGHSQSNFHAHPRH